MSVHVRWTKSIKHWYVGRCRFGCATGSKLAVLGWLAGLSIPESPPRSGNVRMSGSCRMLRCESLSHDGRAPSSVEASPPRLGFRERFRLCGVGFDSHLHAEGFELLDGKYLVIPWAGVPSPSARRW